MNTTSNLPPSFLVLPEHGDRTVAGLYARVRKVALKQLLTLPTPASPHRRTFDAARKVIARIGRDHSATLLEAIGHPDVLTPLLVSDVPADVTGQKPEDMLARALTALLPILGHLAPKGIVPEAMLLDLPLDVVPDAVGHRVFRFAPPARGLVVDPLGTEFNLASEAKVRLAPGRGLPDPVDQLTVDRPFHRPHAELPRLEFALYDSNPLSMFEAHPDKWGNAISLGDKTLEHWLAAFHEALEILRVALPEWFEELKSSARRFVPVGYLPERHLSATYREAPGIAYLTLCDEPITIAEAIVHETQHTKVNLLSWVDPVVHNGLTAWTRSPVRPDLRPLWGVLLAVHAFVPVSAMYDRLAAMNHPVSQRERFPRRWAEINRGNDNGLTAVLETADPTPLGKRLIDEMAHLHRVLLARAPAPPPEMAGNTDILPDS